MPTNTYESPLSSRYASDEMLYLFSADKKFSTWRRLWVALARAEMELGLPVTQEQVEELDRSMREPRKDGLHIGYANSLKRLRYSYGEKADIEISSEPGEGVCVTVTFPYDLEEEDEPFDCE